MIIHARTVTRKGIVMHYIECRKLEKGDSMKRYIECRNAAYDKIRITFWRTRWNGMTLYKASVTPCKVDTKYGLKCKTCEPMNGYQYTLNAAKRASKKAEDSARSKMIWFVKRALDLLAGIGFDTVLHGRDLVDTVNDIVKSIECEVY